MTSAKVEYCPVCKTPTYKCNCSKEALWLHIWELQHEQTRLLQVLNDLVERANAILNPIFHPKEGLK